MTDISRAHDVVVVLCAFGGRLTDLHPLEADAMPCILHWTGAVLLFDPYLALGSLQHATLWLGSCYIVSVTGRVCSVYPLVSSISCPCNADSGSFALCAEHTSSRLQQSDGFAVDDHCAAGELKTFRLEHNTAPADADNHHPRQKRLAHLHTSAVEHYALLVFSSLETCH